MPGSPSFPDSPAELVLLAEKVLSAPIKDGLVAYCPSMDLIAIVTTSDQAQIFRLNGQRVVSTPSRRGVSPVKLCWKPNGSLLAIAYDDNVVALVAPQGGKIAHQIQCPVNPSAKVTALGWGVSFTDAPGIQSLLAASASSSGKTLSLDDVIYRGFVGEVTQPKLDLPSDLASIDVEDILPKLSLLPVGGKGGEVFTTRASLDALFHNQDRKSASADTLMVGFEDGSAWLSVHDFFEVGRFDSQQIAPGKGWSVIKHAYHPYSPTQSLLLRRTVLGQDELFFAPLDLKLISDNGRQFSLLARKSTQLLNVLRYVKESQVQIYNEFNASQTLPERFVANVEEDLREKEQTTFKTAVYHLVATGDCSPVVKEWLVDQLGDRGQKRWEKAASSGYENTRRLLHENLLPALDRVSILLARLRGLALFHETANAFGLNLVELDRALDTLKCLYLLGHSALLATNTELRQSSSFRAWLKQEIDIQAAEHPPTNPDEADREPNFDYGDLFQYIEGPLQRSRLYDFFDIKHESDSREVAEMPAENDEMYEPYKSVLQKIRDGQVLQKRLPGMTALVERLQTQCSSIFSSIAETQQKKVRFGDPVSLGSCHHARSDMRMMHSGSETTVATYIATIAPDCCSAKVIRADLALARNFSTVAGLQEATMRTNGKGEIIDIKFVDDHVVCLVLKQGDEFRLMWIPYHGKEVALTYARPGSRADAGQRYLELSDDQVQGAFSLHTFDTVGGRTFLPAQFEVNGRKGRRAVCVVAQDGASYRLYDIDSSANAPEYWEDEGDEYAENTVMEH